MGFRFRRRLRVMKGVYLNLSKSRVSTSLHVPGATLILAKADWPAWLGEIFAERRTSRANGLRV
jgi:hypothetical protein